MVKILLKGGLPVFRDGALVTVVTDATGCGCCGGGGGASCSDTPVYLTADTTDAGTANVVCSEYGYIPWDPCPGGTIALVRGATCPGAYWNSTPRYVYLYWDSTATVWRIVLQGYNDYDNIAVWYGIKATGSDPTGTYVVDITAYIDCGTANETTGTVVVTETI